MVLTWQAVGTQIVVRWLKCCHPSMKIMWSLNTELWQILSVHIICPCDLDLWPIFPKIGPRDPEAWWIYVSIWKFMDVFVFEIWGHNIHI